MGRAPCCGRMGLKKGPWSQEEDMILVSYIQTYGHGNWRALPKQAGLSRCGKSCRLRWTNYLRPDVKRGDFTMEEEETIIYLHALLGNRWSAIASKLPGRTDNEIKNIWHTCLKKRFNPNQSIKNSKRRNTKIKKEEAKKNELCQEEHVSLACSQCHDAGSMKEGCMDSFEELSEIEDILWPGEALPAYKSCARDGEGEGSTGKKPDRTASNGSDAISFWMNLLVEAGNLD